MLFRAHACWRGQTVCGGRSASRGRVHTYSAVGWSFRPLAVPYEADAGSRGCLAGVGPCHRIRTHAAARPRSEEEATPPRHTMHVLHCMPTPTLPRAAAMHEEDPLAPVVSAQHSTLLAGSAAPPAACCELDLLVQVRLQKTAEMAHNHARLV